MKFEHQIEDLKDGIQRKVENYGTLFSGLGITRVASFSTALLLTTVGFVSSATAQVQPSRNVNPNRFREEQPRPAPIRGLYERPDFFEEGRERLRRQIRRMRRRRNQERPQDLLTIEEDVYRIDQNRRDRFHHQE